MHSSIAICFAILSWVSNSATAQEGRIYDGYLIDISKAPYMAQVNYVDEKNFRHRCGGGILRDDLIITGGHCNFLIV